MQNKIRNTKRWKTISITFLLIIFIMLPYFVLTFISHNDQILHKYFDFIEQTPTSTLASFTSTSLPSKFLIYGLSYIGLSVLCLAIGCIAFYVPSLKHSLKYNNRKLLAGTVIIISLLFVVCILFSISEYKYDTFTEWCRSLKGGYSGADYVENIENMIGKNIPNRDEIISTLKVLATGLGTKNPYPYSWIGINVIWWLTGLQMIFIIFLLLKVGFRMEWLLNPNVNLDKIENIVVLKDTFNQSRARKIIGLFLIPNEFNISLWIISFSVLVFTPQLVYTFIIGGNMGNANKFFQYSYLYSNLTINVIIPGTSSILDLANQEYFNVMSNIPGNPFFINITPIIFSSLVVAMLLTFMFVMIKKPNLTKKGFVSFYVGYLLIVGTALVMFLVSQSQMTKAVDYWNSQNDWFKNYVTKEIFGVTEIPNYWLSGSKLMASGILSFVFIAVLSTIAISHILKIKNSPANKDNRRFPNGN